MTAHTPAPWRIENNGGRIIALKDKLVATIPGNGIRHAPQSPPHELELAPSPPHLIGRLSMDGPPDMYDLLPLCGCGDPEAAAAVYLDVLRDCAGDIFPRPFRSMDGWPDEARLITMYALDRAGLLEHGGTVMTAWLTGRGKQALDILLAELESA